MGSSAERLGRNAALVLMAGTVVTLVTTVVIGFGPALKAKMGWAEPTETVYATGQAVDVPASVYADNDRTLIVFASGTCPACIRSSQALSGLIADFRDSRTRVFFVTPTAVAVDQDAFIRGLGVPATQHLSMDTSHLRLKIVPTLVLVDRLGKVLYAREGLVDEAGRQAIRRAADGPTS